MKLILENWNKFLNEEQEAEEKSSQLDRLPDKKDAIESLKQVQEILLSIEKDERVDTSVYSVFENIFIFTIAAMGGQFAPGGGDKRSITDKIWYKNLKLLIKDRIRRFEKKKQSVSLMRTQTKILDSIRNTFRNMLSMSDKIKKFILGDVAPQLAKYGVSIKEGSEQHRSFALELLLDKLDDLGFTAEEVAADLAKRKEAGDVILYPEKSTLKKQVYEKYKQKLKETLDPETIKMVENYIVQNVDDRRRRPVREAFQSYYAALARGYQEQFTGDLQSRLKEMLLILRSDEFDGAYVEDLIELVTDLIGETSIFDEGF
jgi:hypothetical protein